MTKIRFAAILWIVAALTFPAQLAASWRWPSAYSWTSHLISDLGVTTCGVLEAGSRAERYVCSPWHVVANAGMVANGILLAVGAVLLWSAWPKPARGKWASGLLAAAGLLLAGVGLVPWDADPEIHAALALLQAAAQWAGMALVVAATWRTRWSKAVALITIGALAVSLTGFALFVDALGGGSLELGLGVTERIAFDILTWWGLGVGCILLVQTRETRQVQATSQEAPEHAERS